MADNNKNPRRTIWLSETEPLSHYDIWLSKNQHLNSDGDPVSDSGVLRDCDYIFKVWDCDNWHPIVGLNSTAANKIDTVLNTTYIDSHGESHTSYREFHVPLFTNPESSPSELFDSGTVGLVINLYVTYEEWQNIFEGDSFTEAFEQYFTTIIHGGNISINNYIEPAEANRIGGIWADEFTMELMVPDLYEGYSSSLINKTHRWLAKAKYKYNHNTNGNEDYNLYVDAKTIINIINQYQEDNPEEPGITPGGGATIDPEVLYRSFYDSESIKRDWNDDQTLEASKPRFSLWGTSGSTALINNAGKFLKIKDNVASWVSNPGIYSEENNALEWVDMDAYLGSAINNNNLIRGGNGITVSQVNEHDSQYTSVGLAHIQLAQEGSVCRKITSNGLADIEWTLLDNIYPLLTGDSSPDIRYVIKGGGGRSEFLRSDGNWAAPEATQYTEGPFIKIENGMIGIKPSSELGSYYIRSANSVLSWAPTPESYQVLSTNNHDNNSEYVIKGCGNGISSPAKYFLNGEGGWTELPEGGSESTPYEAGDGIEIQTPLLGNKIIKGNIKECNLSGYNSGFNASTSIEFRAPSGLSVIKNVVTLDIDGGSLNGGSTYDLLPYTYTKINLAYNGTINFIIDGQTSYVNGNPIYVILSIPTKTHNTYTINIKDSLNNNSNDFISINNALVLDSTSYTFGCDVTKFLITMQFGIIKIEPLGYIESDRTEPESEPEIEEPSEPSEP